MNCLSQEKDRNWNLFSENGPFAVSRKMQRKADESKLGNRIWCRESGNMVAEGIWSKGKLIEEIRCFNGGVMIELKRNGSDNLDPTKRIPIYVGGFRHDEEYT